MQDKWRKAVINSLIHVFVWLLMWFVIVMMFSDSPSRFAYGSMSAWWCTLYVGYIRKIGLRSLFPVFILHTCIIVISLIYGLGWFLGNHDAPTIDTFSWGELILDILDTFVVFVSPIIINSIIGFVSDSINKR